jgi:hypothetical protein
MAQGEFTKEEAKATKDAVEEIFRALTRPKRIEFLGHFNDVLLFLGAAERAAPPASVREGGTP